MDVVTSLNEIENNIRELERGRSSVGRDFDEYKSLITRGKNFFPYLSQKGISFAPSRFIGYINNSLKTHTNYPNRDGRVTSKTITQILNIQRRPSRALEQAFSKFCESIGVIPAASFGNIRKYWLTPEINTILDDYVEDEITANPNLTETEKQRLINSRIGQGEFRKNLLALWGKCCITGCDYKGILRASHIKPWCDSDNHERLDKFNGLLLSPNYDALFDTGLISFSDKGEILISANTPDSVIKLVGLSTETKINLQPEHAKYLAWHRTWVFQTRNRNE